MLYIHYNNSSLKRDEESIFDSITQIEGNLNSLLKISINTAWWNWSVSVFASMCLMTNLTWLRSMFYEEIQTVIFETINWEFWHCMGVRETWTLECFE